ncbi:hypothetical protein Halha_2551 [Halobacteroides halobius DSM 5150]|uniref:Protein CotJB domain-containing protein n=1 Tax=Halobacteroides halobius (strain ATCC 35273 / DSM 5150 / MD-1) TaxID=748449 RepID=L0KD06_HALHC|nr:spore coat protein CotJB [Halobacteroides halobius]AGB42425.1 hypothetical protein Halha_2551 [Halobacteroides halobius DSM 5150]
MDREQMRLLKKMMALEFAGIEYNLYLNTHPQDKQALRDHNKIVRELEDLKEYYQETYGPIIAMEDSECPWQYPKTAWPWEIKYR